MARRLKCSSARVNFSNERNTPGATQHEHASTVELAFGNGGGGAVLCCAEPQAKRARHVKSEGAGKQLASAERRGERRQVFQDSHR
jgi:hypothetical protein